MYLQDFPPIPVKLCSLHTLIRPLFKRRMWTIWNDCCWRGFYNFIHPRTYCNNGAVNIFIPMLGGRFYIIILWRPHQLITSDLVSAENNRNSPEENKTIKIKKFPIKAAHSPAASVGRNHRQCLLSLSTVYKTMFSVWWLTFGLTASSRLIQENVWKLVSWYWWMNIIPNFNVILSIPHASYIVHNMHTLYLNLRQTK